MVICSMDVWFNGKVIQLLHTTQYMEAAVCVCVCVCVCDWVSEWVSVYSLWERERERECECVCVCDWVSEWVSVLVSECIFLT